MRTSTKAITGLVATTVMALGMAVAVLAAGADTTAPTNGIQAEGFGWDSVEGGFGWDSVSPSPSASPQA
ncbi:hypothetical protein Cme02nite_73180 [Catellatospora methionotrophica]|uniref:Uncharacterized protein n=1 Tax=Catellatospora methionotrophica TaxID=121620 RepID=A0A8J3PKZ5_9ACTN|nr:hypothetical protein [Catellatospora methionotrophica]GIG18986.1 hypothetical protein Cme02nite_73180 [Catellatospora methionotrophica]